MKKIADFLIELQKLEISSLNYRKKNQYMHFYFKLINVMEVKLGTTAFLLNWIHWFMQWKQECVEEAGCCRSRLLFEQQQEQFVPSSPGPRCSVLQEPARDFSTAPGAVLQPQHWETFPNWNDSALHRVQHRATSALLIYWWITYNFQNIMQKKRVICKKRSDAL